MNTAEEKIQQIISTNTFIQLLAQLDTGRVVSDLAEKLPQLTEKVKSVGKAGTITLTLKVKPEGSGEIETVEISADVKVKNPEKSRKATIFFITEEHQLSRTDPGQTEIQFDQRQGGKPGAPAKAPAATAAR